ncbi:MAG: rod shape-determining protein MreC [Alphaproteobacteria bacterium]
MGYRPGSLRRLATPIRVAVQRSALVLLLLISAAMIGLGRADITKAERIRTIIADAFVPLLDALSRPATTVRDAIDELHELASIKAENMRLKDENLRLQHWQQAARELDAENKSLKELLSYIPPGEPRSVTARVVSDSSTAYVRSVLVNAGDSDGVRKGQAVVNGNGLVGRVTEVGQRAARVLLVTDINSRIPILIEATRHTAILSGDNSDRPKLRFLPVEAEVAPGDRIVTSGHGGVFPPGITVGVVATVGGGEVRIQPLVNFDRLEYVRILDYGPDAVVPPATVRPPTRR